MWTKGKSHVLLIRVKTAGRRVVLPVPLFVFDQLFEAFGDLFAFILDLLPARFGQICLGKYSDGIAMDKAKLTGLLKILREFWDGLQSHGHWQLLEIEAADLRVDVWFN